MPFYFLLTQVNCRQNPKQEKRKAGGGAGATVSEAMMFLVLLLKQASKYRGIGVKEGKTNGKLFNLLFIQSEVKLCLFAAVFLWVVVFF